MIRCLNQGLSSLKRSGRTVLGKGDGASKEAACKVHMGCANLEMKALRWVNHVNQRCFAKIPRKLDWARPLAVGSDQKNFQTQVKSFAPPKVKSFAPPKVHIGLAYLQKEGVRQENQMSHRSSMRMLGVLEV